ncbi:MAG TPA: site-specific integrase, partial [Trueperaceae bacterium]|nr:site-specific integrase [Trueperaceae bacterium]
MHESAYDLSFDEAVRDFCDDQEYKGNSPATVRYYRSNLGRFQRDAEIAAISDFSERKIRRWLVSHRDVSSATLATYDRCLRVFARWLHHRGYVDCNPMANLSKPRNKTRPI